MTARQFGRYRLDRLLGRGAAGEVWLAFDPADARTVAVKILSGSAAEDPDYRRRFEREARIGAQLTNAHVAPIHHFGEVDGRLYLDMAYIPGVDLARLISSSAITAVESVELISQVAQALDAAHAVGLVHRDVKPANIIVHSSGFTYLIDFGIARAAGQTTITATGFTVGTLAYMAPERFTGHGDGRSDVYSLACVLYECLTARRPFGDTDAVQQLHAHLHQPPPQPSATDPGIPAALDAVVARGMAKDPESRYATAGELAAAARAAVGAIGTVDRIPPLLTSGPTPAVHPNHDRTASARSTPAQESPEDIGPQSVADARTARATRILSDPNTPNAPHPAARPAGAPVAGQVTGPIGGPVARPTARPRLGPRPTLVARTPPFSTDSTAAQYISPTRRRPPILLAAGVIGAIIVTFAVVAAGTALLGSDSPGDSPHVPEPTGRPAASTAPATNSPATPEPEHTPPVVPPRLTIPVPSGAPAPPFRIPGAAQYSHSGPHKDHGPRQGHGVHRDHGLHKGHGAH